MIEEQPHLSLFNDPEDGQQPNDKGHFSILGSICKLHFALDYVWDKAKEDRTKEKAIFIDEAWELIGDDDTSNPNNAKALAGEWVQEIFKIIRGYGGAAVAATQDIGDLDRSRFGKGILNVAKTKIILNLETP